MPDARDIVVVHSLKLKKEPVLHEMKAFMENGAPSLFGQAAVQDDGVRLNVRQYRNFTILRFAGFDLHFTRTEKQNARRSRPFIEWQLYDFQPKLLGKRFRLQF